MGWMYVIWCMLEHAAVFGSKNQLARALPLKQTDDTRALPTLSLPHTSMFSAGGGQQAEELPPVFRGIWAAEDEEDEAWAKIVREHGGCPKFDS